MARTWDYIPPIIADAATQMAIDAALADLCNQTEGRAVARFYAMSPPAVTIGRHQQWRTVVDPELCRRNGWDWVRRPTGGGALLHRREVNYAVAVSHDILAASPVVDRQSVFNQIAQGLMAGLVLAGFRPILATTRKHTSGSAQSAQGLCGASLTRHEISIDGRKAVAAAQWNLSRASLQHGTIYLLPPGPEDRFWPENAGLATVGQQWWAWEDPRIPESDRWQILAAGLKEGLSGHMEISWRQDPADWVDLPGIADCKKRWLADGWHTRR